MYAAVCVWFDQYNHNRGASHREGLKFSIEGVTNWTHRKDVTASGDRMRDSEDSKTIALVSQEAGFSAEVGKGQSFVTRLSMKSEGRFGMQRVHIISPLSECNIGMSFEG